MAKMDIPDKICPYCGGTEWYVIKFGPLKQYTSYQCVKKKRLYPEQMREYNRDYYSKNREKCSKRVGDYFKSEKGKEYLKRKNAIERENLSSCYIKHCIICSGEVRRRRISIKDITEEQVVMYRQSLLAKRLLKKLKNENI